MKDSRFGAYCLAAGLAGVFLLASCTDEDNDNAGEASWHGSLSARIDGVSVDFSSTL